MENNYETLRMPELKALAREHRLRGYSRLRKADLIAFLQNNEHHVRSAGEAQAQRPPPAPSQMSPSGSLPSCWFHGPRIISAASNVVF